MTSFGHDLRLGFAIALNVAVLAAGFAFARRVGRVGRGQAVLDALLVWYAVQYAAVLLPGVAGVLNAATIGAVGFATAIALSAAAARGQAVAAGGPSAGRAWDVPAYLAVGLFLVAYIGAYAANQLFLPPVSTDALGYHLPSAVQWLQDGRLSLFETWYWNPANAYSPMAASAFLAWLIAPMGNDVLARFVQVPALAMIAVAVVQLGRAARVPAGVAALVAAAAVLSRPLLSQTMLVKDDLLVASFFITTAVALTPAAARDRLGPWRLGLAGGLLLATKYPALLTLPALLVLIDGPWRAGWRVGRYAVAGAVAVAVAGGWYVRNAIWTGNPLFPVDVTVAGHAVLPGLFTLRRDPGLAGPAGVWRMLTGGYHGVPVPLLLLAGAAWAAAALAAWRRVWREPAVRFCVVGPVVGLLAFVALSPHPEVRYFFPAFLPLFATAGVAIGALVRRDGVQLATATAFAAAGTATGFAVDHAGFIVTFTAGGAITAALGVAAWAVQTRVLRLRPTALGGAAAVAGVGAALWLYVNWTAYVGEYREGCTATWSKVYGPDQAAAWAYVRDALPPGAVVAYANTNQVYPLYGFDLSRRVVYAPVRPDVTTFRDLPPLGRDLDGYELAAHSAQVINDGADATAWAASLRRRGATHVYVERRGVVPDPPELRLVHQLPGGARVAFENAVCVIYALPGTLPPTP